MNSVRAYTRVTVMEIAQGRVSAPTSAGLVSLVKTPGRKLRYHQ